MELIKNPNMPLTRGEFGIYLHDDEFRTIKKKVLKLEELIPIQSKLKLEIQKNELSYMGEMKVVMLDREIKARGKSPSLKSLIDKLEEETTEKLNVWKKSRFKWEVDS